jgi:hypothetical protein
MCLLTGRAHTWTPLQSLNLIEDNALLILLLSSVIEEIDGITGSLLYEAILVSICSSRYFML